MALVKPSCPPKTHVVPTWACSLGKDQKKSRSSPKPVVFFLLNHYSRGIWCYIRSDFVGLFPLINQPSNPRYGYALISMGGHSISMGGRSSSMGDASPPSPLQFKHWAQAVFFWGAEASKYTPVAPGLLLSYGAQSSLDLKRHSPEVPPPWRQTRQTLMLLDIG